MSFSLHSRPKGKTPWLFAPLPPHKNSLPHANFSISFDGAFSFIITRNGHANYKSWNFNQRRKSLCTRCEILRFHPSEMKVLWISVPLLWNGLFYLLLKIDVIFAEGKFVTFFIYIVIKSMKKSILNAIHFHWWFRAIYSSLINI